MRAGADRQEAFVPQKAIISLVVLFSILTTSSFAQETSSGRPLPCVGVRIGSLTEFDQKVAKLDAENRDLKSQIESTTDDAARAELQRKLDPVQSQLLELTFQRECVRTDYKIQVLRAPGDPPPAWIETTTFFATNRAASGDAIPANFFGSDRRSDIQYGKVTISIPTARQPGDLNLPSLWRFEVSPDPNKHFVFKSLTPLDAGDAQSQLAAAIKASPKHSLLVFVHGYNTSFFDAAMRTSQLAHDLSFQGQAIFFSWPSAATTAGYSHDEEAVQLSEPAFNKFLDDLGSSGATDIILIAHSMGNRLVTKVLSDRISQGKQTPNLRELLLAAPDINAEIFREQILPGLEKLQGTHRSIYASSADLALRASKIVHDYRRVGETIGGILTFTDFETIDASAVSPSRRSFGHSYIVDSVKVLGDIAETIDLRFSADQRNLPHQGVSPSMWWTLK
jgi:esterase/lipase superfamily enzyme